MSDSTSQQQHPRGPPYAPTTAGLGGYATVIPDVVICSILLLFYIGSAVGNMFIFQANKRKGIMFAASGALFGFSMSRILTLCLRIGTATHPHNISLAIAANIFVNAGILIVYVINLVLALRILRARLPTLGWQPAVRVVVRTLYAMIGIGLVLLITFIVIGFYTLNPSLKQTVRDVQLAVITYFLVFTCLPFGILAFSFLRKPESDAVAIGKGSMRAKALIILTSTSLCVLNSGFKAGINWMPPRPVSDPAWYDKKAAFYVFIFCVEIVILYFFIVVRIDRRFYVPDGSSKRKSFVQTAEKDIESQGELPVLQRPMPAEGDEDKEERLGTGQTDVTVSDKDSANSEKVHF